MEDKDGKRPQIKFRSDDEVAREFKAAVALKGSTIQDVLEAFVKDYVRKYGVAPKAPEVRVVNGPALAADKPAKKETKDA